MVRQCGVAVQGAAACLFLAASARRIGRLITRTRCCQLPTCTPVSFSSWLWSKLELTNAQPPAKQTAMHPRATNQSCTIGLYLWHVGINTQWVSKPHWNSRVLLCMPGVLYNSNAGGMMLKGT